MALPADPRVPDGRRARRERNRTVVIDAVFELLEEGHLPPPVDRIAERSGVSVSSVFRYFQGLDDLQEQTVERYFERFVPLFEIPAIGDGPLDERIERLVSARVDLYEATAPIARLARMRAPEHPTIERTLQETRRALAEQLHVHFGDELSGRTRAEAADLLAAVETLTSFESWDLLSSADGRSRRLVARAWTSALRSLLA